jgi:tetratricopeptide (TPR) repeat protein
VAKEREALELASQARQPKYAIQAGWFLAKAWGCRGEYQLALDALGQALELSERVDAPAARTRLLNTLGWLHAELGSRQSAEELNRLSTDLARELVSGGLLPGAPELHGNASINLACNRIGEGELGAAAELLAPIREELSQPGDPWMRWRYGLHLLDAEARLALARGDAEGALASAQAELSGARRHGARKLELRALELRGRARLVMDLRDEAEADLRAALSPAQELGHPPVRWRAHSLLAEVARRNGDVGRARAEAAQVQAIVESLAGGLREEPMRRRFRALGQRLVADPLGAWR